MRVGFDYDGVIYNFGDSVHRYMKHKGIDHLWKSGPTPTPFWDWYKDWGWTTEQFLELCHEGADAGFIFRGPARENAVEAVWKVKTLGHQLIGITDRSFGSSPEVSQRNTHDFLNIDNDFPLFDEIHFTADKTSVHVDCMVEDKLTNYDALIANSTPTYLINRAWNEVPGGDARNRIHCISEYADAVEALTVLGYTDLSIV